MSGKTKEEMYYFKLNPEYRKKFLSKTTISETDIVFIYDYSTDWFISFPVRELNIVATLNDYSNPDHCPCPEYYYMIGFEINKEFLMGFSRYYTDALVYVGAENPFVRGEMKVIAWEKIASNDFPLGLANDTIVAELRSNKGLTKGEAFLYEFENFKYFVQSWTDVHYNEGTHKMYKTGNRHLLVVDKKSGEVVVERLFRSDEGRLPAPLNFGIEFEEGYDNDFTTYRGQWAGKLFKNKPPVVFGFEWDSYGCPYITFLNRYEKNLYIRCDNRH
jgi:hypothetical protein